MIIYGLNRSMPGDPVLAMMQDVTGLEPEAWQRMYDDARARMRLDEPVINQYFAWITNIITGNFGYSHYYRQDVVDVIRYPMLNTVIINIFNMMFVFSITIFLGITAAVRRGSVYDAFVQVISVIGFSFPTFVLAILVIFVFAVNLGWFPISGMYTPNFQGTTGEFIFDRAYYMTLPLLTMVVGSLGGMTRYVRTTMAEALTMDHIRTARAKGLAEKVVIYSHAFRNALIPLLTVMTNWFITVFGGSVALERVFNWNGMGGLMLEALWNRDFNLASILSLFYAAIALTGFLLLDLVYGIADPRVRVH